VIPLHAPHISKNDIIKVSKTLKSGWVSSSGKLINEFENNLSKYTGSKYCLAVSSGTSALHLSLLAIKLKENDEVIVPSVTFIAPVNAINYVGAKPIFMDVDNHLNIDSIKVINFLNKHTYKKNGYTYNKKSRKRIRAIIIVHVFGNPANIEDILKVCRKKNIECIEDSAEGLGSFYSNGKLENKHVGTIGKIGCLSFNGNKIITTGAGGAILTNSKTIYKKIKFLSTQAKNDDIRYIHNEIGYNYRMPNLLAALGITQLKSLEENLLKKRKINLIYKNEFANTKNVEILSEPEFGKSNYWLNVIIFRKFNKKKHLDKIIEYLDKKGIQARPIWKPNHLQKPYLKSQSFKIENVIKFHESCLCLPSSSNLSQKKIVYITRTIKNYLEKTKY
jgi:perosamine synthetase